MALVLIVLNNGCSTTPVEQTKNGSGTSLATARAAALKFLPGTPRKEVEAELGHPDKTAAGTYGQSLGTPWNGVEWTYEWLPAYWTSGPRRIRLVLVFEPGGSDAWALNSWKWYDY